MAPLADLIRQKIDEGRLPREKPVKVWAGYGTGVACSACDDVIRPAQAQYDFTSDGLELRVHVGCFGLWEAECRRLRWRKTSSSVHRTTDSSTNGRA